ncbi:UNVERIFIED_CONTAM: hypothetical protein K2H54_070364 [Gekko kuhli]
MKVFPNANAYEMGMRSSSKGKMKLQFLFRHLTDQHLEQAANNEQGIVSLPDEEVTRGERKESVTQHPNGTRSKICTRVLGLRQHKERVNPDLQFQWHYHLFRYGYRETKLFLTPLCLFT